MKIILAPDSFKGSLTSMQAISIIKKAVIKYFPYANIVELPIADGGEGTVEALVEALHGEYRDVVTMDPIGRKIKAVYGIVNGDTAVIETAAASGLPLLSSEEQNPLYTSTYGTGEIIKAVLDDGLRKFIIGIGGSATNDGGMGVATALGINFLDKNGNKLKPIGENLQSVRDIDFDGLDPRISDSDIVVMCDVQNPLTGSNGATYVYGRQKGADDIALDILERGMVNYADVVYEKLCMDNRNKEGAGAAGGLGFALSVFFNAKLKPGIEAVLDAVDFDNLVKDADLVITGEGSMDGQSIFGKVPVGIAKRCKRYDVPVSAIAGGMGRDAEKLYDIGIGSIMTTINGSMAVDEAMERAEELMYSAADRMLRFIRMGMDIRGI